MPDKSRTHASATAQSGARDRPDETSSLTATGDVSIAGTGAAVGGVLVEIWDVASDRCVGSGATDSSGRFAIRVCPAKRRDWLGRHHGCPLDLQAVLLVPERVDACRDDRVIFRGDVRRASVCDQYFKIELPAATVESSKLSTPAAPISVDAEIEQMQRRRKDSQTLASARNAFVGEDIAEAQKQAALFHTDIAPELRKELSGVTDREAASKEFVKQGADVQEVELASAIVDAKELTGDVDEAARRETRFLLTEAERTALIGTANGDVEKSEKEIEEALDISLDKPALIDRKSRILDACLPPMDLDDCLQGLVADEQNPADKTTGGEPARNDDGDDDDNDNDDDDDSGGQAGDDPAVVLIGELDENGNGAGAGVSFDKNSVIAKLTGRMTSPEDPVEFGAETRDLESQLTVDQVSANIADVTFAPGPADVPSFHNFSDLQVAFAPVWQEVLDDRYIQDAEQLYNKFVEKGGKAAFDGFVTMTGVKVNFDAFADLANTFATSLDKGFGSVAGFVMITEAEWDALPGQTQDYLSQIAVGIRDERLKLQNAISDDMSDPPPNLSFWELVAWKKQAAQLSGQAVKAREKLRLLKNDADEIVAVARRLLLEKEANKPFAPTHAIIEALRNRSRRAYPFRPFAASRAHRSVNFGVMVGYQQIWTPKSYQVGELVKTIPLAPNEERTYTRKTVQKTKSSIKKIESVFERMTGETQETGRYESEIVRRATAKTNFDYQSEGQVNYGTGEKAGVNVRGSQKTGFSRNVDKHSRAVKKEFNEAVRKATQEVKNELKTEIDTETVFEEEFTETGKLINPNNEITCTFLFYELQRRYQVEEKINQLQSVVLVAQEVPSPSEIDKAWLIGHDWILSRVLLDPSYAPALGYLSTSLVGDEVALTEMRKALFNQRKLVEEIKEDLADRRVSSGLRYEALQKQVERSARKAEGGGGFFGGLKSIAGGLPGVGGIVESGLDLITGGDDELDPATELRERAARDAFDRERQEEQSLEGRLSGALSTLSRMESEYTDRISAYLTQMGQCDRLAEHVVSNILYYMQAIWAHEPPDQRELRLRHVQVPVFEKDKAFKKYVISAAAAKELTQLASSKLGLSGAKVKNPGMKTPPPVPQIETQDLFEVADLSKPLGVWANYLIFPMLESNVITEYMMEPYVTLAEKEYGVTDPDILGNMTLAEFADYVCCLKRASEAASEVESSGDDVAIDPFEALKPELRETLKKLLERAGPDGRDIVVPMDGLYIEALPGTHSVMERFKHIHRQVDVKQAQAEVREAEIDNVRQAQRILADILDDPDVEKKYVIGRDVLPDTGP